ncbi:MAG: hypothetical protein U0R50_04170 [Gaiellales bacterium]
MASENPLLLDDDQLDVLIARLSEAEQHLSAKRTALHKRIDFLGTGGYAHLDASAEQLTTLQKEDRELSEERQALHSRLDTAVAEQRRRSATRARA